MGDPADLPQPLRILLERFAERAQIPASADRAACDRAIAAYFENNPVPPDLKRDFGARYRDGLANLDVQSLSQASLQLTGEDPIAKTKAPPGEGPKGPLAFFAARAKLGDEP